MHIGYLSAACAALSIMVLALIIYPRTGKERGASTILRLCYALTLAASCYLALGILFILLGTVGSWMILPFAALHSFASS